MTKHDIELPMLPAGCLTEIASMMRNYASAAIKTDRQQRGEPVAWRWRWKDLPDSGWQLSSVGGCRETDAIRAEPLYLAPIAPQPALDAADLAFIADELRQAGKNRAADLALTAMAYPTQPAESHVERARRIRESWPEWKRNYKLTKHDESVPAYSPRIPTDDEWDRLTESGRKAWGDGAEPVKVPSDEVEHLIDIYGYRCEHYGRESAEDDRQNLLARYGQSGVPEGWQLVPKMPTHEMIVAFAEQWYCHRQSIDDPQMDDAYQAMIEAAPEPPCDT